MVCGFSLLPNVGSGRRRHAQVLELLSRVSSRNGAVERAHTGLAGGHRLSWRKPGRQAGRSIRGGPGGGIALVLGSRQPG